LKLKLKIVKKSKIYKYLETDHKSFLKFIHLIFLIHKFICKSQKQTKIAH